MTICCTIARARGNYGITGVSHRHRGELFSLALVRRVGLDVTLVSPPFHPRQTRSVEHVSGARCKHSAYCESNLQYRKTACAFNAASIQWSVCMSFYSFTAEPPWVSINGPLPKQTISYQSDSMILLVYWGQRTARKSPRCFSRGNGHGTRHALDI